MQALTIPRYCSDLLKELGKESTAILDYWMEHMVDEVNGGFHGSVDNLNNPDSGAPKGIVLNSRILWTFSLAYNRTNNESYRRLAERAFNYMLDQFADHEYGGVYWSVNSGGSVLESRKQIYGQAFCIYGMTEYYKATGSITALHFSKDLFGRIEKNSFDEKAGGYFEAFDRKWRALDDQRLSEKDENEKKTMNTHLHIIEAYANLYGVWKHPLVYDRIVHLLDTFRMHFIDAKTHHLRLFLDENWNSKSSLVSYGHDIEASWLLLDCARAINNESYQNLFIQLSLPMLSAAMEGLDADGGLWYEYDVAKKMLVKEKHSWPQAEALVAFANAWQLTGDEKWLVQLNRTWEFIKKNLKDVRGEWFWGINGDKSIMQKEKAGFWKCPYHNYRACGEVMNRIQIGKQ